MEVESEDVPLDEATFAVLDVETTALTPEIGDRVCPAMGSTKPEGLVVLHVTLPGQIEGAGMDKVALLILNEGCMGCHACEVACKQEHGLEVGPKLIEVVERSPLFLPIYCHHCARPPCQDACPANAIFQDERGIVLIDKESCIGCKACVEACPFAATQFDEEKEVAVKCDLCQERLGNGEEPACARACPTQCILWGSMDSISRAVTDRVLARQAKR